MVMKMLIYQTPRYQCCQCSYPQVHGTAIPRYMVLPERPLDSEGWTEQQLAAAVTRDSMIGVAVL